MTKIVRPKAHEIDTLARRIVPLSFPKEWEHREITGTDYGIDMMIEIFKSGCATGNVLSLQIKGTTKNIKQENKIAFDIPVTTLKYSELFLAPVLLVLCDVNNNNNGFYYLWLQEYIRVVLNFEKPNWRKNKATVRVKIPIDNYMPGSEDKLDFIADYPRRIHDWCQFARIFEDLKYKIDSFINYENILPIDYEEKIHCDNAKLNAKEDLKIVIKLITELTKLDGIFGYVNWKQPRYILERDIIPALEAAKELYNDSYVDRERSIMNLISISHASSVLSINNDYSYSNWLWKLEDEHNF